MKPMSGAMLNGGLTETSFSLVSLAVGGLSVALKLGATSLVHDVAR